jgi:NAD(P)-dependent dehydrogenase (short-subunit alcohol dehydrogenase family)
MFAMSYCSDNKGVSDYNMMGPVKAALEASASYLAYELGLQDIRVHPISPGPFKTRAASGQKNVDLLLNEAEKCAPLGELGDSWTSASPAPSSPCYARGGCRAKHATLMEVCTSSSSVMAAHILPTDSAAAAANSQTREK